MIKYWGNLQNAPEKNFQAKKNYILNVTSKLTDSNTAPKTYWALINCLLYN